MTRTLWAAALLCLPAVVLAAVPFAPAGKDKTAEELILTLRARKPSATDKGAHDLVLWREKWQPRQTAVIVCDMWDSHHSLNAVRRVEEIAPRMNQVLEKARSLGLFIIHAPSSCMTPYQDHPARKRAQAAPKAANLPRDIGVWCYKIPAEEKGIYPVDQTDGGCDTPDAEQAAWQKKLKDLGRKPGSPWLRQIDVLKIHDEDAISDSGVEIWNLLEQRGIKNVILVGVHTNMCVLGRPFGLRQLAKNGKNVVLMRDMTDTMYNPRRWPYVAHFQGTDLIVQHIEKFVCPTTTSDELLGGQPFRFKGDVRKRAVVAIGEPLYDTHKTLPRFATRVLEEQLGLEVTVLHGAKGKNELPGLAEALPKANLLLLSIRRRALPEKEMAALKKYLDSGKPLMAIRTSSHAFDMKGKGPVGTVEWAKFDAEVLGGNYQGHHPDGPITTVDRTGDDFQHAILTGLKVPFTSKGSLYRPSPLARSARVLLTGTIPGKEAEPVAWTNTYKSAKVFYTSLGHAEDFQTPQFVLLMHNAARWALDMQPAGEQPPPRSR
ncbi:MAG: isochorismatase family protein [Gemmataceae bacterium]|nr:isochorismatase family protein [Gemmataceae bacterium]